MKNAGQDEARRALAARIAAVQPEDRARWGRMSAHGMICHLCDSLRFTFGEKEASIASGWVERNVIKWLALYAPVRWPKGVPTRPEMEQGRGGTAPAAFEQDRSDLLQMLERFCAHPPPASRPHPIFGPLTTRQWLRWGYLHIDHHLRQFGR